MSLIKSRAEIRFSTVVVILSCIFTACKAKGGDYTPPTSYTERSFSIGSPAFCRYSINIDTANCDYSAIVYYFHGTGGDEHTWLASNKPIIAKWESLGKPLPVVVSVTFGSGYWLYPEMHGIKRGYLEIFHDKIIPLIESNLPVPVKKRYLFGFSMGGQGAAQLLFRYPQSFQKAVLVSPAVYPISPYVDENSLNAFIAEAAKTVSLRYRLTHLLLHRRDSIETNIRLLLGVGRDYLPDQAAWDKADIAKNISFPPEANNAPQVLVWTAKDDTHGLHFGAMELAEAASAHSYKVRVNAHKKGHGYFDVDEVADFLISR